MKRGHGVSGLGFLADNQTIVAATQEGRSIQFWEAATGKLLREIGTGTLSVRNFAVSPDGNSIAFIGFSKTGSTLWVRPLDRDEPRLIPSSEGALSPFWSADGKSLGFFADGKLKRVPVAGGPAEVICAAEGPSPGGTWNKAGVILFAAAAYGPIYRVPAAGGKPEPVTRLEPFEEAHRWPAFLPA